ncbi:MAG: tRNA (adenosine(37)-N6)-threonylcarbamoyltransferase complex ATPase subunit type 1 TsaE [Steroidobacter sp.]
MRSVGRALGRALLGTASDPVVIGIEGELGAGKTTLVAGVLASMGVSGPVRSPTYTLVEPYELPERAIYHLDLYRLADPREAEALGIRDLLNTAAVLLIEWPSRGIGMLPHTDLDLDIQYESEGRVLRVVSNTRCGDKLVQAIVAAKPELSTLSP